jgi:hypothetical protein
MPVEIRNHQGVVLLTIPTENLRGAALIGAALSGAALRSADLSGADLRSADLRSADLRSADLRSASLSGASLSGASLSGADLRSANLRSANLRSADLSGANLSGANLSGANPSGANLSGANLTGAKLPHFQIVPSEGEFVAWKKTTTGVIRVQVPADAVRTSSLVGRKCRASHVIVMDAGGKSPTKGELDYSAVGSVVTADKFDDDIRVECTHGIHFFMTRVEAEEYR